MDEMERSGALGALRNLVRSHTGQVWWWDDAAPLGTSILHSGTVTFVNTGPRVLGFSAHHVYQGYLNDKAAHPGIRCQIGSALVEPEKYVYAENPDLDLVAFALPAVLQAATGVQVHRATSWPPPPLQPNDLVIFGGYPGNRRQEMLGELQSDFVSFIGRIYSATESYGSLSLELGQSHWPQGRDVGRQPDLGGMSGGPAFRIHVSARTTVEFAGVIYEYHQPSELVFARHASLLNVMAPDSATAGPARS